MGWTFERAEADIAQLADQALDKDDFCWAAGERIAQVVDFDASCWHTHDPATLLITSHITERLPFCRFELLAHDEYATDDVNLFAELATSRRKVRTLRGATRNRPDASERYRELFVPNGIDGELRAALVDGGPCWGGVIITRAPGSLTSAARRRASSRVCRVRWPGDCASRSSRPPRTASAAPTPQGWS